MARSRSKKSPAQKTIRGCLALVPVDSTAIRKKFSQEYEKARREIEQVRTQLRRFEETDKPAFSRWLHRELGATLSLCRELEQKVHLQEMLLFQVQETSFFGGISPKKAYERVMREQEASKQSAEAEEGECGSDDEPPGQQEHRREREDRQGDFFSSDGGFPFSKAKRTNGPPETMARLKDLYRTLVRKLHPDLQKEMTAQKADWWHQAQAAYERQDAEQLEIILCFCEIHEQQSTRNTSLSLLQRITRSLKSSLRPLRRELKDRQQEPGWNFSRKQAPELIGLARHLKAELESDVQTLRGELADIEEELEDLKSQKRSRRSQSIDPFDLIFGQF